MRAAKTLVALLPGSIEQITRIIHWSSDRYSYEAHFTLFVFLADVEDLGLPDEITSNVRDLLGAYLVNVSVPTAGAAWMAGHALGDHFENPEAAESLHHLALDARFAVGRSSAVTGLSEWLQEHSTHDSRRYRRTLASIAKRDKSARVRASARVGLERIQAKAHK
ncbi:MAG: hypothetical protein DMF88_25445 [Acidobacteria bacterium]|nr:MAG: hypothetical protein DMF88_25445 [Acidobacteriota bacterium]